MFVCEKVGGGDITIIATAVVAVEGFASHPDECLIVLQGGFAYRVQLGQREACERIRTCLDVA